MKRRPECLQGWGENEKRGPLPLSSSTPGLSCMQGAPQTVMWPSQCAWPCSVQQRPRWPAFGPRKLHTGPVRGSGLQEGHLCRPRSCRASLGRSSGFPGAQVCCGLGVGAGPGLHRGQSDGGWRPDLVSSSETQERPLCPRGVLNPVPCLAYPIPALAYAAGSNRERPAGGQSMRSQTYLCVYLKIEIKLLRWGVAYLSR